MDFPPLTILLFTYTDKVTGPRAQYASRTLESVLSNLEYSGPIHLHIADDGSPKKHVDNLVSAAKKYSIEDVVSTTNAERRGYGASYNLATQVIHERGGLVLPLEDDWELVHPLNLDTYARALLHEPPVIGCIRLGYIGLTQELKGSLGVLEDTLFLFFDPSSAERHIAAGHPRLETVEWERRVGPWDEGVDPGTTEHLWCGRLAAREGVAWPMNTPQAWFVHIGTEQARDDQKEAVAV